MLIDLGVACAWIAMSLVGALGLGSLRRHGAESTRVACREEASCEDLYSFESPAGTGLFG